jgi:hypothetical protein
MRKHKLIGQAKGKVLIVVRGGVVQAVFSNDKNLQVDLLDFDNEEFPDNESAREAFAMRRNDLIEIGF